MMLGAYVALTLILEFSAMGWDIGLAFWLALPAAMILMAAFGFLLDRVALRPMVGQPQFAIVILTIALGFVFRSVAGGIWSHEPRTFATPFTNMNFKLGGVVLGAESIAIIVGTLVLSGALFAFFRYTRIGIAMQAASQNQLAAYYMGIPVKFVFALIWAISAAVSAAAGVLLAPTLTMSPDMGLIGLVAFAAAVIGGFGSLPGALLAGLMIGVIKGLTARYGSDIGLPEGIAPISAYILMLFVLILRPQGLFAQIHRKKV